MAPASGDSTILIDGRLILDRPTGIGAYLAGLVPELARAAPELQVRLLRSATVWPDYELAAPAPPNLEIERRGESPGPLARRLGARRELQRTRARILHHPHLDAPNPPRRWPLVVTIHDAKYALEPELARALGNVRSLLVKFALRATLRRADAILVPSAATAADLQRMAPGAGARITVTPYGVARRFAPAPADAPEQVRFRAAQGLTGDYLLAVGEHRAHKNHVRLIDAFSQSRAARDTHLLIVGSRHAGWEAARDARARSPAASRIRCLDRLSDEDLAAAYAGAALVVLPSLHEGFCLPALEAMACGAPVIAGDGPALREVLGEAGRYVDPRDVAAIGAEIDRLLAAPAERRALAARGRERAAGFTWARTAAPTVEVYRALLNRSQAREGSF